jgi:hypothetical protein
LRYTLNERTLRPFAWATTATLTASQGGKAAKAKEKERGEEGSSHAAYLDAGLEAQASTGGIVFQKEKAFDWQKYQQCRMIVCQHQSGSVGARLHFPYAVNEDAVTGTKLSLLHVVEKVA